MNMDTFVYVYLWMHKMPCLIKSPLSLAVLMTLMSSPLKYSNPKVISTSINSNIKNRKAYAQKCTEHSFSDHMQWSYTSSSPSYFLSLFKLSSFSQLDGFTHLQIRAKYNVWRDQIMKPPPLQAICLIRF